MTPSLLFPFFQIIFLGFVAPRNVTLRQVKKRSLVLSVMPAPDSPGVTHYKAVVEGNSSTNSSCLVKAQVTAMECELEGLTKATDYLIMTRACVMTSDVDICGDGIELTARTLDQGTLISHHMCPWRSTAKQLILF